MKKKETLQKIANITGATGTGALIGSLTGGTFGVVKGGYEGYKKNKNKSLKEKLKNILTTGLSSGAGHAIVGGTLGAGAGLGVGVGSELSNKLDKITTDKKSLKKLLGFLGGTGMLASVVGGRILARKALKNVEPVIKGLPY